MERPKGAYVPDEPGALPLDQVLAQVVKDDQEEWEYEYSATETETFYLTVELSYPEFKKRSARAPPQHSRGGYYKNWADQDTSLAPHRPPQELLGHAAGDNSDNEVRALEQDYEDDGTPLDPVLLAMSKGSEKAAAPPAADKNRDKGAGQPQVQEEADEAEAEDIQILDLHSPNPLFSYRGRLFQGQWAEVIGTEAILASTSSDPGLPALRTLPGDISLLAASSSRIMTTEKIARPKIPSVDTLAPIKEEWNIQRGDKDQVTVYATDGQGKDWDDRKAVDYRPRRKRVGEEDDVEKKKKKVGRRPKGRPSLSTRLRGYPVGFGEGATRDVELSTMTPATWDDLERQDEDEEGSEEEEQQDDEDENEDEDEDEDVLMTG
ncbi:hypothetical protein ED733_001389 [Metarhizium rileyi]|uniref:Transcription factor TFIIIC triple barrel domain-containing protein n=1 Tax=Metarhizium rileyi (strain RCEF 4871) TaxID=1649241 RepID=A0A5C6G3T3_METRR|nr:hypothetical protein ED733_001389 [Metarhizium rileyi]